MQPVTSRAAARGHAKHGPDKALPAIRQGRMYVGMPPPRSLFFAKHSVSRLSHLEDAFSRTFNLHAIITEQNETSHPVAVRKKKSKYIVIPPLDCCPPHATYLDYWHIYKKMGLKDPHRPYPTPPGIVPFAPHSSRICRSCGILAYTRASRATGFLTLPHYLVAPTKPPKLPTAKRVSSLCVSYYPTSADLNSHHR